MAVYLWSNVHRVTGKKCQDFLGQVKTMEGLWDIIHFLASY